MRAENKQRTGAGKAQLRRATQLTRTKHHEYELQMKAWRQGHGVAKRDDPARKTQSMSCRGIPDVSSRDWLTAA